MNNWGAQIRKNKNANLCQISGPKKPPMNHPCLGYSI